MALEFIGQLVHSFLELSEHLASSNTKLAEEMVMRSVRIEYGWDILGFGAVLVIAAGLYVERKTMYSRA